ncbi:MAG: spermidine/putrescine transport ATP-binding protein PotD [Oscillospiraceae bacterium]|jgi:spermidine/putrescine transport system substrate-binding protein|nr:spermidine/putrescine transport ATP-binding protein PotD [Oscillospiraceae bacterium]
MKKMFALVLSLLMVVLCSLSALAYDNAELFAELDMDYYSRFKGQDISINVYNWGEYISDGADDSLDVNKAFEELTGIKVNYTFYATNEELYAKLRAGGSSYDVIIPSEYMIGRMVKEDMLEEINKDNIPNLKNIDPLLLNMNFDPNNAHFIPYTWGTVVLIYNKDLVSADTDVETWDLLWNEKYKGNILMFNNPRDAYGIALKKLGYGINPENQEQIDKATALLKAQKPVVQAYVMDEIFDKMGAGEAAIAPYYSGDAITMMNENPALAAAFPREGTNIFVDGMCIPKGANQKEAAEMYINFMCEPAVGAANCEYIGYSTPNLAALELLDDEVKTNPIAYPSAEVLAKTAYFVPLDDTMNKALDAGWKQLLADDESFTFWLVPALLLLAVVASIIIVVRKAAKKKRENY